MLHIYVRGAFAASLIMLAACSSTGTQGPPGPAGKDGAQGPPGMAGAPGPAGKDGLTTSGNRIVAQRLVGTDGAAQFLYWHDTKLDVDCQFHPMSDGAYHCVPALDQRTSASIENSLYFSDPACTVPVYVQPASAGCPVPYGYTTDSPPACGPPLTEVHVFEIGAQVPTVYSGTPCTPMVGGLSGYAIGTEVSPTMFVGAQIGGAP